MSVAFVFPAQGSHSPGMLHQLLDHPAVARTLEEISEVRSEEHTSELQSPA